MNTSKEQRYFIPDLETGFSYEVNKETYESYMKAWELLRPKLREEDIISKGRVIVFGTAGDMENGDDLKNIFNETI